MVLSSSLPNQNAIKYAEDAWALVIDDHPMFCDALELTLGSICDFSAIKSTNSIAEATALIEENAPPSLVVLDLNLPDVKGFDGLTRILALVSTCPLVVVSSVTDNKVITSALKIGASGFVPKHSPRSVFKAAIDTIQSGRVYVPDNFLASELSNEQSQALEALSTLTAQQARILDLISEGLLNKQIAHELSIAEATVKAHVTAIMRKLGVNNRTQAVLVAKDAKLETILPKH
ncbi:MAG: response regulator transcription factor [Pseudomonadota bacterium]